MHRLCVRVAKIILALSLGLPVPASVNPRTNPGGGRVERLMPGRVDTEAATKQRVDEQYGTLPLSFEKNEGQSHRSVAFLSRGRDSTLFLLNGGEAVIALPGAALRLTPVGAQNARAEARQPLPGTVNYLRGQDRSAWRSGIATYARVTYTDVYPGVDLEYYGNKRQLEYDFIVRPGADPRAIVLEAAGADRLEIDARGDLVMHIGTQSVRQQKPIVYQQVKGVRHEREGRYALQGSNRVTFELGAYDAASPLVIDPVLIYSTYLGGALTPGATDGAFDVAIDASGFAYVTGYTTAADFPATAGAFDTTLSDDIHNNDGDVFISKLHPNGATAVYSTFIGGKYSERGQDSRRPGRTGVRDRPHEIC
jgi:hypothetical protein